MSRTSRRTAAAAMMLCLFGFGAAVSAAAAGVAEQIRQGVVAYAGKHFVTAGKHFGSALARQPASPTAALDLGTAQYRAGKYRKALASFRRAATDRLASGRVQELANYDQGKALAKLGDRARNPSTALGAYRKSVEAFHRALQIDPHLRNAAYNIEVVRRRMKRLERKLPKRPSGRPKGGGRKGKPGTASPSKTASSKAGSKRGGTARSAKPPASHAAGARQRRLGGRSKSSQGGARASSAASRAQQILNRENKHPRIMNVDNRQVSPRVAQDW